MKVRIGVADSSHVIELEVDDPSDFEASLEATYAGDTALLWFEDVKRRRVGLPRDRIAYVEVETEEDRAAVGFSPKP